MWSQISSFGTQQVTLSMQSVLPLACFLWGPSCAITSNSGFDSLSFSSCFWVVYILLGVPASPGFFHTLHSTIPQTRVFQRFLLRSTGILARQFWIVFCFSTHFPHSTANPSSCLLDMTTETPFSILELNQCRPEFVTMMSLTALASSHSPWLINY